ncbi:hypothetical protein BI081_gp031 [Mycobacterium phage Tonenili]|uniref:Uncharacterized protein n=1 Tax=Mycobacterium phage Tonenili TaxID=1891703 RepID=A0A1C9EH12_9CAUD|nr:hypothetical protein BI081_gp031 [Mycobacterium phage Tonenili]AON96782.1 hypothetical protein SEA_TONENILI_31 [Mycobacterium phage Tonenili]
MEPYEHYVATEDLLVEGRRVVAQISDVNDDRAITRKLLAEVTAVDGEGAEKLQREVALLTERMDELGKKAMGIWAQAQVHAALARVPSDVVSRARVYQYRQSQYQPSRTTALDKTAIPRYETFSVGEEDSN